MERRYVGVDLHRRRSVIVRMTTAVSEMIAVRLDEHAGYQAVQAICGVGPVLAAVSSRRSATSPASPAPPVGVVVGG